MCWHPINDPALVELPGCEQPSMLWMVVIAHPILMSPMRKSYDLVTFQHLELVHIGICCTKPTQASAQETLGEHKFNYDRT